MLIILNSVQRNFFDSFLFLLLYVDVMLGCKVLGNVEQNFKNVQHKCLVENMI